MEATQKISTDILTTPERNPDVLRDIARRFNGQLALNADVLYPGMIRIGDAVTLKRAAPTSTGNMWAG